MKYSYYKSIQSSFRSAVQAIVFTKIIPIIFTAMLVATGIGINSHAAGKPPAPAALAVQIISPTANAHLSDTITLSAQLPGLPVSAYDMFWYVDHGQWNWMATSNGVKAADINLTTWTWHGSNDAYTIDVVARLHSNGQNILGEVPIHALQSIPTTSNAPKLSIAPPKSVIATQQLYVDPSSHAIQTADSTTDTTMQRVMTRLAQTPTARWFGDWNQDVKTDVDQYVSAAANAHALPVLVAYNIPGRDCGSYSAGGSNSADSYKSWINNLGAGISGRAALVILEPDAVAQLGCLSSSQQTERYELVNYAVATLKASAGTHVYIDAGNPTWVAAQDMAARLQHAGITQADGFSLNVSNFIATTDSISYGTTVANLVGNKHFIIDTSRNGNGSNGQWCNPYGRALGAAPTRNTGNNLVDYFLWIKTPGESDGTCNGGPVAGVWWPEYAENLALNASW